MSKYGTSDIVSGAKAGSSTMIVKDGGYYSGTGDGRPSGSASGSTAGKGTGTSGSSGGSGGSGLQYWEAGTVGGGGSSSSTTKASEQTPSTEEIYSSAADPAAYKLPEAPKANIDHINHVDVEPQKNMLQQLTDAQKQQTELSSNYTVQQGVNELNRAMEDAAVDYQTQRNQIAADEAQALDNQALYAEARGDRGGIGAAQYASIQNNAAQNRRSVNSAQTKLSTDTARQISDLRAQGEFEKADALLSITQSYLSQLMSLEQWALETNLGVDEFNTQIDEWLANYNMSAQQYLTDTELAAAQLTGMFSDGTRTYTAQQNLISSLANTGSILLQAGMMPTAQQLEAMGMTATEAQLYLKKLGY